VNSVIKVVLKGRIPSKKNSRIVFVKNGRLMNLPSKDYVKWHKLASEQVSGIPKWETDGISKVELSIWAPDKRASDLTNKAESVMDLLVDNGIIKDDNWWIVNRVELIFKGVDRANPRCEVLIHGDGTV